MIAAEKAFNADYDMEDAAGAGFTAQSAGAGPSGMAASEAILDIREYDIPYYLRVSIDKEIRVGLWYEVTAEAGEVSVKLIPERVARAEPVVMAYDIETTKAPLKFPDSQTDQVMMVSYMIDGQGFLITNREIVSADIEDFEYTPKPEFEGPFTIFNEPDEAGLISRFFEHIREAKPTVMATYNGDSFDMPFLETRAAAHGIDMYKETGFTRDSEDEFKSRGCVHMDCFRWVKRDSYLPQGSQGLKAVTVAKLGYNPIELDPELMTPYAVEQPQTLAQYSVSDAVATYYLYMKYVHPFVFSLCNIIPLNPDEVLRKGTGTLCETLLMVEAFRGDIIMPNKHVDDHGNMFEGHLLESETYVGGHVEALEAGVFRSDISTEFKIVPEAIDQLLEQLDDALQFSITAEGGLRLDEVTNYDEVKQGITAMLTELRANPLRHDKPLIYHLDVAAMYPNIMLSNRLQPDSVVTEATCAACDYNRPGKQCQRKLKWTWRGDYFPAKMDEYKMIRNALEQELLPPKYPGKPQRRFVDLSPSEQTVLLQKRLGDYSRKVYKKTKVTQEVIKETIICQRENPFYIDTVKTFRDRRYTYKGLHKDWKKNLDKAVAGGTLPEVVEAKGMIVLYDSLQLAHKCILNSFYGYVMRKGARWHSMEMAGITCHTGSSLIQMARLLVQQIGRPLELDTDGIWCMLPATFPDEFKFKLKSGKTYGISYPCTMLNHLVYRDFTNDQYHELVDKDRGTYEVRKENSIFFELDGPYRAMILPSSKEEDKLLKKRYAVFNDDGSLAELKGFEVKRRGELQLIKTFQSQIFEKFLLGETLQECYASVAVVADKWLDVLFTKGLSLPDDELVELIAENRSMSKTLAEYGGQKSTSISTARRLAEFLGEGMVKDKGLACKFIISTKPHGAPVTERAVPVAIFSAELTVKRHFLRKWLKDNALEDFEMRSILDWDYYIERLGSVVQKLITIPAALQKVANPVPRIRHPDWLFRRVANLEDKFKQHKLDDMFRRQKPAVREIVDVEDMAKGIEVVEIVAAERTPSPPAVAVVAPDMTVDYAEWVAFMKPIWKEKRRALKGAGKSSFTTARKGTLGAMLHQRSSLLGSQVWDIVQIAPVLERPGEFKMWLLISDSLQSVRLKIRREFLVNFIERPTGREPWPASAVAEALSRTLPRGQGCLNLVRVSMDEHDYLGETGYGDVLNSVNVDGVYEQQVPLIVRALLKLGSSCVPDPRRGASLNQGLDSHFELDDLDPSPPTISRRRYLDSGRRLKYAVLMHTTNNFKSVLGLFLPNGLVKVCVVEKGNSREVPNLEKVYADLLAKRKAAERARPRGQLAPKAAFEYPDEVEVEVVYTPTEQVALRALSKELAGLASQKGSASLLVIHSPKDRAFFDARLPAAASFPYIVIQSHERDNAFPALQWQGPTAKRLVAHYLDAGVWIQERIDLADRFDVPVCNLERDVPLFLADLELARRLKKADMVMWWSPAARPDLGGREADANAAQFADELSNPEIGKPGSYSSACLEIDIRNLAVDAVLQSALVYELEGGEGGASMGFEQTSHNLDEYAKGTAHQHLVLEDAVLPQQTFNLIRLMVKGWTVEAAKPDGMHFRLVLDHFWRWVSSPAAKLFDPALHKFVHGLMRKTFSQLVAEFRRLGSEVVHADFHKLFLLTNKPSSATGFAYANYIVASVTSRDLFRYVQLDIVKFWDHLVWMDQANMAGIECTNPEEDNPPAKEVEVNMTWNIATFLPPAVQDDFARVVGRFVAGMYHAKRKSGDALSTPLRIQQNTAGTQAVDPAKSSELDAARQFVHETLTRQLLKAVAAIQDRQADKAERDAFRFPLLPGSHLKPKSAVLEFVKTACAVFALARDVGAEVLVLRRNLLDVIGVREFAAEAQFRNPCLPFRVPAVVCAACNAIKDLDLCRNVAPSSAGGPAGAVFACERCAAAYDALSLEMAILEATLKRPLSYALQDLKCKRCGQPKTDNLRSSCECSGDYLGVEPRGELARRWQVIENVAGFHEMEMVKAVVKGMRAGM